MSFSSFPFRLLVYVALALMTASCATRPSAPPANPLDSLWRSPEGSRSARVSKVIGLRPGENAELVDVEGPGVVRRVWITAQSPVPQLHGLLVLRAWWDDESEPSVEVPLGDFYGVGFGQERELKSMMVEQFPAGGENHAALVCYWPMPFARRARIAIENRGERPATMFFIHADYERLERLPDDAMYFHAQWRRENPVALHKAYTILDARGRGRYVGTVLNYRLLGPGAWVEGGDNFYIDGDERPTLPGTGAEDYFGQAWGFRRENNAPLHGTSFGPDEGRMTAYRWHILEPVRFDSSIRVEMRCHGWDVGDRQDDYSSVAYWYQAEPHAPFPVLPSVDYEYLGVAPEFRERAEARFSPERLPPPPPGRNLAREAVAVRASGHYNADTTPERALDGRLDTKWCDAGAPGGHWLAVDFGAERAVAGFVLKNPSTTGEPEGFDASEYRVETAPTLDGPWQTARAVNNDTAPTNPELNKAVNIVAFERPVRARCVRLYITREGNLDSIARIQEFEVYGE